MMPPSPNHTMTNVRELVGSLKTLKDPRNTDMQQFLGGQRIGPPAGLGPGHQDNAPLPASSLAHTLPGTTDGRRGSITPYAGGRRGTVTLASPRSPPPDLWRGLSKTATSRRKSTNRRGSTLVRQQSCVRRSLKEVNEQLEKPTKAMMKSVNEVLAGLRYYSDWCFYWAMFGFFTNVLQREVSFNWEQDQGAQMVSQVLRGLVSLSTLVMAVGIVRFHHFQFMFSTLNHVYLTGTELWPRGQIMWFCLEMLVCLIHEPPFLDFDFDASLTDLGRDEVFMIRNPWTLMMIFRFFLLLRFIVHRAYSGGAFVVGIWNNFNFTTNFALKNMLFERPIKTLVPLYCSTIAVASWCLLICERPAQPGWNLFTSFWVIIMSMTGIGFGDLYPITSIGRLCVTTFGCAFLCSNALLIASVTQLLTLRPYEKRMVEFLQRTNLSKKIEVSAVDVLASAYLLHRSRCQKHSSVRLAARRYNLRQCILRFQKYRTRARTFQRFFQVDQMMRVTLEGLTKRLDLALEALAPPADAEPSTMSSMQEVVQAAKRSSEGNTRAPASPRSPRSIIQVATGIPSSSLPPITARLAGPPSGSILKHGGGDHNPIRHDKHRRRHGRSKSEHQHAPKAPPPPAAELGNAAAPVALMLEKLLQQQEAQGALLNDLLKRTANGNAVLIEMRAQVRSLEMRVAVPPPASIPGEAGEPEAPPSQLPRLRVQLTEPAATSKPL